MKLQSASKWISGLIALLITSNLFAQNTDVKTLPDVTITSGTNVSKKVSDVFATSFKDATNTRWYKANKSYLVRFITADMNNQALYSKRGYLIYHIAYGHENNLPKDIRKTIKSNYVDYNITHAINVKQDRRNIWVVNLEDDKSLIIARVEDGELEEVSNLSKAKTL